MQPAGVVSLPVGGVFAEASGLADAFGQIFREVADVATRFLGAPQDALDVHLGAEADDVGGFVQFLTRLVPAEQWRPGVGVGEGLCPGVPDR